MKNFNELTDEQLAMLYVKGNNSAFDDPSYYGAKR